MQLSKLRLNDSDVIIDNVLQMKNTVGFVLHLMQTEQKPQCISTVAYHVGERWLVVRDKMSLTDHRCLWAQTVKRLEGCRIMIDYLQFLRHNNLVNGETFNCYLLILVAISKAIRDLPELSAVCLDNGILDQLQADLQLIINSRAASEQVVLQFVLDCA